jgi:hypothetical protein
MKNIIILLVVIILFFFMYRSCTEGYEKYGYFVHAKNEAVFNHALADSDPNIIGHGRKLIDEINLMDRQIDDGDGSQSGLLRWYVCSGIDCDEGWQTSFTSVLDTNTKSDKRKIHMDTYEKSKVKEYSQYDPARVAKDVEQDIVNQSIKLFYIDLYEVPEVLSIDERPENFPSHQSVYIGTGCTDPYHSDDCAGEYRRVMDNALLYGRRYNKAVARHLKLKLIEDAASSLNATGQFIGVNESGWNQVKIELSDIQPLFGGRRILIDGGSCYLFLQTVRPCKQGLEQKNYTLFLEKDEMEKIIGAFIENDFLSLRDTEKKGVPDQATPTIILENFKGKVHSVWNWAPPVRSGDGSNDDRFHAIYSTLLRFETRAHEMLEPITSGPYNG